MGGGVGGGQGILGGRVIRRLPALVKDGGALSTAGRRREMGVGEVGVWGGCRRSASQ